MLGRRHRRTRRPRRTAAADWGRNAVGWMTKWTATVKQVVRRGCPQTGETYTPLASVDGHSGSARAAYAAKRAASRNGWWRTRAAHRWPARADDPGRAQDPRGGAARGAHPVRAGRGYTEPQVNEVLSASHEDFAYLRRELVNYRYLERAEGRHRGRDSTAASKRARRWCRPASRRWAALSRTATWLTIRTTYSVDPHSIRRRMRRAGRSTAGRRRSTDRPGEDATSRSSQPDSTKQPALATFLREQVEPLAAPAAPWRTRRGGGRRLAPARASSASAAASST